MIGKVWAGNVGDELFGLFHTGNYKAAFAMAKAKVDEQEMLVAEAEEGYDVDKMVPRKLPHIGMMVCDCRYKHLKIAAIDENGDDITLEDGQTCSYSHCIDNVPHVWAHPCPVCREGGGFHNDDMHRKNIDPKYLLEKGWHNVK